jgi:hypothetical protein
MSTRPERLLRPLRPEPLRSRDDEASNCQAVVSIVRIPVKSLGVCRVLMPEVTCVPSQLVQLLVFFIFGLRARGNRDTGATLETLALPGNLTSPLEGFSQETIWYRFMCPEAECQKWIACNDTYNGGPKAEFHHHLSVEHKIKCWPTDVKSGWVQAINIHSAAKSQRCLYHLFHLDNYQPPGEIQPSFPTKVSSAPPNTTWFKDLQWCEFQQKICDIPLHQIQSIVASRQLVEACWSRNNSRPSQHCLELGLLRLQNHITEYIDNTQQFISSIHKSY